jgi:hypothetical protein
LNAGGDPLAVESDLGQIVRATMVLAAALTLLVVVTLWSITATGKVALTTAIVTGEGLMDRRWAVVTDMPMSSAAVTLDPGWYIALLCRG